MFGKQKSEDLTVGPAASPVEEEPTGFDNPEYLVSSTELLAKEGARRFSVYMAIAVGAFIAAARMAGIS